MVQNGPKWSKMVQNSQAGKVRKKQKNNTWDSNVVPHRSTNQARTCLTSLSRREAVLSCWYGRSYSLTTINRTPTAHKTRTHPEHTNHTQIANISHTNHATTSLTSSQHNTNQSAFSILPIKSTNKIHHDTTVLLHNTTSNHFSLLHTSYYLEDPTLQHVLLQACYYNLSCICSVLYGSTPGFTNTISCKLQTKLQHHKLNPLPEANIGIVMIKTGSSAIGL